MVLAKRHVQRLWFPLPGAGGSIPSRAENSMSQEEFDRLMPHEFWREVVDRVAAEVPGTLLLAEAFWLLEGYFVRTLGMHRVYNSAFMNMLRDEENAKYRSYLKKTIEFDPDIMKRYVNFMSNPDERTAIDQFGTGDKYFGVCTLLATLPGLPMFGHGQIEGYTERYGMEFKQAKMDEWPNEDLVARHQREIAPLLKQRRIFAGSADFTLYDFWNDYGAVDENVFAYSNRTDGERSLVLYNNKYDCHRRHHPHLRRLHGQGQRPAPPAQPRRRPRPHRRPQRLPRLPRQPRPRIPPPRLRHPLPRHALRPARLPVRRPARLARAPPLRRVALGPPLRSPRTAPAFPTSTTRSPCSACARCTMPCATPSPPTTFTSSPPPPAEPH